MTKNRSLILPSVIVGIVLLVIGVVYIALTADGLPSFFPGHEAGSSHHHVKHGIAAIALALAAFVLAWFQTEPKPRGTAART
jgi:amino acid permease